MAGRAPGLVRETVKRAIGSDNGGGSGFETEHDSRADAVYIRLSQLPYAFGVNLDPTRRIDFAANGEPIGIELLQVSKGVDLFGLPERSEIAHLLEKMGIRVHGVDTASEVYTANVDVRLEQYDQRANAVYLRLRDLPYAFGVNLDPGRRVDFAAGWEPIGVELLDVNHGVDLIDLPAQDAIAHLLVEHGFGVFGTVAQAELDSATVAGTA